MRLNEIEKSNRNIRELFQFLKNYADNPQQQGNVLTWGNGHQITIEPDGKIIHQQRRSRPQTFRNEREFRRAFTRMH